MGFRYRKSINLGGGFRINVSKSGIGYSWGTKGVRITKTARGTTRTTTSIPGTGISFVNEKGKKKRKNSSPTTRQHNYKNKNSQHSNSLIEPNNHYNTEEIINSVGSSMVSEGLENILKTVRKTLSINKFSNMGIGISIFLSFINPAFIFLLIIFIILKKYIRTVGLIDLEYIIDEDQKESINQQMEPMLKITNSEKIWRIMQSSKVIDKKYSGGASSSVKRIPCIASKKAPFPFKTNIPVASFKSGSETLLFLPDKLFIIQKTKVGALNYSDISISKHTQQFIESEKVPKDTTIVGSTWKYINKSGEPDRRFKDNYEIPVCLYGEMDFQSTSGLNTIIMFSNPNL